MNNENINNKILYLTFIFFVFSIFFLRWFNLESFFLRKVVQSILLIFALLIVKIREKKIEIFISTKILFIFLFLYVMFNYFTTDLKPYFVKELLLYCVLPIITLYYFIVISNNKILTKKILNFSYVFLNIYSIINMIIIILQLKIPFFMMRNTYHMMYYKDQLDGLLGLNSTHYLSLFYICAILINYYYCKINKNKISYVLLLFNIISSSVISLYNDNKAYYILLAIFLLYLLYDNILSNGLKKNHIFLLVFIFTLFFVTSLILTFFPNISLNARLKEYSFIMFNNNERIELFNYALNNGNGYKQGMGIGSILDYADPNMPKHFGLSNLSSLTYQGGLIYLFLNIIIYIKLLLDLLREERKMCLLVFVIVVILFLCFYTQPFSESYLSFLLGYIFLILSQITKAKGRKKNE